jgi:hypothetical protein
LPPDFLLILTFLVSGVDRTNRKHYIRPGVEIVRANSMVTTTNATLPATRAESADMIVLGSLPLLQGEDQADYERWR